MTSTITAYRDGKFCTVDEPNWWGDEIGRIFPEVDQPTPPGPRMLFGDADATSVRVWYLHPNPGTIVAMNTAFDGLEVWCPSTADLLDLLTTRAPAFLGLTEARAS